MFAQLWRTGRLPLRVVPELVAPADRASCVAQRVGGKIGDGALCGRTPGRAPLTIGRTVPRSHVALPPPSWFAGAGAPAPANHVGQLSQWSQRLTHRCELIVSLAFAPLLSLLLIRSSAYFSPMDRQPCPPLYPANW